MVLDHLERKTHGFAVAVAFDVRKLQQQAVGVVELGPVIRPRMKLLDVGRAEIVGLDGRRDLVERGLDAAQVQALVLEQAHGAWNGSRGSDPPRPSRRCSGVFVGCRTSLSTDVTPWGGLRERPDGQPVCSWCENLRQMNSAGRTGAIPISTFRRPSRMSCAVIVVPRPHRTKNASFVVAPARAPSRHFCAK